MFRSLVGSTLKGVSTYASICSVQKCAFSSLPVAATASRVVIFPKLSPPALLNNNILQNTATLQSQPSRSVTKFTLNKGKRKSVKAVIKRFRRLDWGGWIRTYTGRQKKLFSKSPRNRRRLRQHVFVNSTQSWLLDKMVTSFWRRPKNWVDDIYAPYHRRDEFFATKGKTFKV